MAKARRRRRLGAQIGEGLSTVTFALVAIAAWVLLIHQFGPVWGFVLGWLVAPLAAVAGAMLVLLWTVPLRETGLLSITRGQSDEPPPIVADAPRRSIAVVMPVYNARHYMAKSLPPLMAMAAAGEIDEVVVVDDGSTDESAAYARSLGATVMTSGGRKGPAGARNVAARELKSDILWFVDADVVARPGGAERIRDALSRSRVTAVFGSYDDSPAAPNFGSQYKNLVHHHYHQHAGVLASTFWAGCGAVLREAFLRIGGFNAERYTAPTIEDVELGYRLRAAGGLILLDRDLLSTHLKNWSVTELVRTDIFKRAMPWSRLMLERAEVLDDLNVGTFERLRAMLAGVTVLTLLGAAVGLVHGAALAAVLLTNLTANWHIFHLFLRRRGIVFAFAGLAFHQLYYLYSTAAFLWCWVESKATRRPEDEALADAEPVAAPLAQAPAQAPQPRSHTHA